MAEAVEVDNVRRVYETGRGWRKRGLEVVALDGISLTIDEGEVHGLLGPNGAGKTTLVKVLSTVLLPTSGTARICGFDVVEQPEDVRRHIGIVFGGERGLYTRLTARQNLRYWGALYRLSDVDARERTEALLERVGLGERADERVEGYSRGMKQRLHLARGLVGDPQVLFLDEPTTGLDPVGARAFRVLIGELRTEGRTILLATHDMLEAEALCGRVSLIDRGHLLATESTKTIGNWISRFERIDAEGTNERVLEVIRGTEGVEAIKKLDDNGVRIETSSKSATAAVMRHLVGAGVTSIRTSQPSLEEVYLRLIGDRGLQI
jgi:ABC-2 type transport system ATP-binding protein